MRAAPWTILLIAAAIAPARAQQLAAPGEAARLVALRDLRVAPDAIEGRLVNLSDGRIEDVRLLVADTFYWADEQHPGPESPGRAEYTTVHETIAPHESRAFRIERRAPPARSDGRFETTVTVVGLTRFPPEPRPSGASREPSGRAATVMTVIAAPLGLRTDRRGESGGRRGGVAGRPGDEQCKRRADRGLREPSDPARSSASF